MKKKIWPYIVLTGTLICIIAGCICINRVHKSTQIRSIRTHINYNQSNTLIIPSEIDTLILKSTGDIIGKPLEEINLKEIEKTVVKNPFVEKADVYADLQGNVHIKVKQREPIVRIKDVKGNQYYIDKEGYLMPLSKQGTPNILLASGNIKATAREKKPLILKYKEEKQLLKSGSELDKIYYLAEYIHSNPFFKCQIDQVYINGKGEFELVPKVGNQLILLGGIEQLSTKLENLYYLYTDGFSNTGWEIYKTINLTFENQIVCTKY